MEENISPTQINGKEKVFILYIYERGLKLVSRLINNGNIFDYFTFALDVLSALYILTHSLIPM